MSRLSDSSFNRLVIITTLVFTLSCVALTDHFADASNMVNHDTIQAIKAEPIEEPDPVICSSKDVDCPEELTVVNQPIKVYKAPVAPTKPVEKVVKVTIASVSSDSKPIKIGASKVVQERIDYAWSISHDKDFIYTMEYENGGTWSTTITNSTNDHGITQINKKYHPKIVNDPRFKDWKFQIEQGWKLYSGGTRYYGYDHRWKVVKNFQWE